MTTPLGSDQSTNPSATLAPTAAGDEQALHRSMTVGDRDRGDGCPGALKLHHAKDGAIGRIRFPGGHLTSSDWRNMAELSREFGDGFIHVTSRGNVQIRGITDESGFSRDVIDRGLVPSLPHDRMRNIIISPRAPRLIATARQLDRALLGSTAVTSLAGRTLFGLDAGSGDIIRQQVDLGAIIPAEMADTPDAAAPHPQLIVAGQAVPARVRHDDVAAALTTAAELWAQIRGKHWRIAEMPGARDRIVEHLADRGLTLPAETTAPAATPETTASAARVGWFDNPDGTVSLGAGLRFGMLSASTADLLAVIDRPIIVTPWHGLIIHDLDEHAAEQVVKVLAPCGLIFDHSSSWLRVTACTGSEGCDKSLSDTRGDAVHAVAHGELPEGLVHLSGCERRCGHPHEAYTDYLATGEGEYDISHKAENQPIAITQRPTPDNYVTDGNEIYRQSFAMIRTESDLERFSEEQETIAVRMIHAAGETDLAEDIEFSENFVDAARRALQAGAPILTDVNMVAAGVTRKRLPADNQVICLLQDPRVPALAKEIANTRSAAAVELWREHIDGAVVAIGNAPTALFHLLNTLAQDPTYPRPAAIIGIPVGFVGAAESKAALANAAHDLGTEFVTVHGRRGGSAITCAAINAVATAQEILK